MALQTFNANNALTSGRGFTATVGDYSLKATYTKSFSERSKPVHVMFVIDASGSMAGSPTKAVLEAVEGIARWLSLKQDSISMWTFNDKVLNKLKPMGCKKVDFARLRRDVADHVGGGTRLNDALYTVSKAWDPTKLGDSDSATFMVFLTDGGENQSKFRKGQVQQELASLAARMNKMIFLTAGSSPSEVEYLNGLMSDVKDRDKFVVMSADSNNSINIQKLFGMARQEIEQVIVKYYHKGQEVGSSTFVAYGGGKQRDLAQSACQDVNMKMKQMNLAIEFKRL